MILDSNVKKPLSRLTMLVKLVMMVFTTLFVSIAVSGMALYVCVRIGAFQPLTMSRFHVFVSYLLLASLLVGTSITILAGKRFLRPIRILTDGTKEIAQGNFGVRVEAKGFYEIELLAQSFNEMAKELSSIETLRSDFVSNISHEFKTPIASIRGFARRLKKGALPPEKQEEYLDIIIWESDRLTRLSSNILLMTRLESSERIYEQVRFSLDEQIRRSIIIMEPQLVAKNMEVVANLDAVALYSNEEMLSHLWLNLIGNAVKFSHDGSTVTVDLFIEDKAAVVSIADTGEGMDEKTMGLIFDKFFQGDQSRGIEGNGLGLALVKRILELEKGTIHVESELGKGSRFVVRLPLPENN
ncbi:MAG: HAMP domain-containing histidine kinase [Eubacteriaceae bacterium]|nr:HAMP domain-containing histidine kinase [Eubacteriaceae bacterium]